MKKMKRLLAVMAALLLLMACGGCGDDDGECTSPVENAPLRLTVVHVNDTHSHLEQTEAGDNSLMLNSEQTYMSMGGMARLAGWLDQIRAQNGQARDGEQKYTLALHAGDAVQGTLYFTKYEGQAEMDFLNAMAFDAMAVGNHEFDKGPAFLADFIDQADFPLLGANIDASADPYLKGKIPSYLIQEMGDARVGIIGLIAPETAIISSPGDHVSFGDPAVATQDAVAALEAEGVNKIIVLSHMGYAADQELAAAVNGVDLIVGGHSHTLLGDYEAIGMESDGDYPTVVQNPAGENVYIVQAWEWAKTAGTLDIAFTADGKVESCQGNAVFLVGDNFLQKDAAGDKVAVDAAKKDQLLSIIEDLSVVEVVSEDEESLAMLEPYKQGIEEMQTQVVAQVSQDLLHMRIPGTHSTGVKMPDGSHIAPHVCEAMVWKANEVGMEVDMSIQNAGGVRIDIPAGDLTLGRIYELLPFGNALFILELSGAEFQQAIESGLEMAISGSSTGAFPYVGHARYTADATQPAGQRVLSVEVKDDNGNWVALEEDKTYLVATNAYIAGGGDGYDVLANAGGYRYDTSIVDAVGFMEYAEHMGTLHPPEQTGVTYYTSPVEPPTEAITLKFIETTDIHGSIFPYDFIEDETTGNSQAQIYSYVKAERQKSGQEVILLDNGDILQGQPIVNYFNFEVDLDARNHIVADVMNYMGYDAATVGNHDVEPGHGVYDRIAEQFNFPWLSANAVKPDKSPYFTPYTIIERQGVKIAVLGLTTPGIPNWLPESLWSGMTFEDMVVSAQYWVPYIQENENPDLLIGLFHSGFDFTYNGQDEYTEFNENGSQLVAQNVPGFDLIFIGHDHMDRNESVNGTLILGGDDAAMSAPTATVTLTPRADGGYDKQIAGEVVDATRFEPDPQMMAEFDDAIQEVKTYVSQPVGTFTESVSSRQAMFGDSAFVDLIHQLQFDIVEAELDPEGAEISFCAPLQFDKTIDAGAVHVRDMYKLYKYENQLFLMEMTGQEVLDYLEFNYANWMNQMRGPDDHLIHYKSGPSHDSETGEWTYETQTRYYNYDSAAGIRYLVDISQPEGQRVTILSMADGSPFELNKTYKVAINSYRGNGGGGHITEGAGIEDPDSRRIARTERDLRYYLMEAIGEQGTVTPEVNENWQVVPGDWALAGTVTDHQIFYGVEPELPENTFAVFADPHYYAPGLGTEGAAFEAYLAQDRKLLRESSAILDAAIAQIASKNVEYVIVPGDLSKDGAKRSHQEFAAAIAELEQQGIEVYVVPGNHDISNPHAYSYAGDTHTQVESVTPTEFTQIYADYGYDQALYRDPSSLSYIAEPIPGVWLFALDSAQYEQNQSLGRPETGGAFSQDTLNWITGKLAEAQSQGKQVLAMMHHGLVEHYTGQSEPGSLGEDYVVENWRTVSKSLAAAGLSLVFTGHYHAQDVTSYTWPEENLKLTDVETGSLVTYPVPYRVATLNPDQTLDIQSHLITEIDYDTGLMTFPEYAEAYLDEGMTGLAYALLTAPADQGGYGLDPEQAEVAAAQVAAAYKAHYVGDENPSPETLAAIAGYLESDDPTLQMMGGILGSMWTDLAPADNNLTVDLEAIETPPAEEYLTLSGYVADGPVLGATVTVEDSQGQSLGTTTTNQQGFYSLSVLATASRPFRLHASGGQELLADGSTRSFAATYHAFAVNGQPPCHITPLTSLIYHMAIVIADGQAQAVGDDELSDSQSRVLAAFGLGYRFNPFTLAPVVSADSSENAALFYQVLSYRASVAHLLAAAEPVAAHGASAELDTALIRIALDLSDGAFDGTIAANATLIQRMGQDTGVSTTAMAAAFTAAAGDILIDSALAALDGEADILGFPLSDAFVADAAQMVKDKAQSGDTYMLSVAAQGNGAGTVTGTGIDCGSDCQEVFAPGTEVSLTAAASAGSSFAGWGGACSGTGDCTLTLDDDQSVTATFRLNVVPVPPQPPTPSADTYTLSVSKSGDGTGTVTSSPAGIDCGTDCAHSFDENSRVTLSATADDGSLFAGWGGACSETGDCSVTLNRNQSVTAEFKAISGFLTVLGTYETGVFDEGAAEIVAHDPDSHKLFVVNGDSHTVDVLDGSDPFNPSLIKKIDLADYGKGANSVAVHNGIVAAAVEAEDKQANGKVVFFDTDGNVLKSVEAGPLPDMITFTPDGTKVLVANEGEPSDDYSNDPEGSVTIIDIAGGVANATAQNVGFTDFNDDKEQLMADGLRVFGPNATVARDMEPEYIAVSADSSKAWVCLQENNAIAVLDIGSAVFNAIVPLGFKDHSQAGNGFDASNKDDGIHIRTWQVMGMYQPDGIASFSHGGKTYLVTANEGDARDYDGFSEEVRVEDLTLDPSAYPDAETLQAEAELGRLKTTTAMGDTDGDGDIDQIYAYGARSFSIWEADGNGLSLVYDSGDAFEQTLKEMNPAYFNSDNDENEADSRSDDKGPEPEGVTVAMIDGRPYAFIGLERMGGIMVYDLSNPASPEFVEYKNNRDFSQDVETAGAKDIGPEGILFIPASDSPHGKPMLAVANEVSGTTTLYQIHTSPTPLSFAPLAHYPVQGGVAEIVVAAPGGQTLVYTDSDNGEIGMIDIANPENPLTIDTVSVTDGENDEPTSVAVTPDGKYAFVAVRTGDDEANPSNGRLKIYEISTLTAVTEVADLEIGIGPDSIAIASTPVGEEYAIQAIVAIEDEEDGDNLPGSRAGRIDVIRFDPDTPSASAVTSLDLAAPLADLDGVNYKSDPQPEYVAVSPDQTHVAVTLQENNAIAILDISDPDAPAIQTVFSAGTTSRDGNADIQDDGEIDLSESFTGRREPDGVYFLPGGQHIVTANEGDTSFNAFGNGVYPGGRNFTIFDLAGNVVFEPGDELDQQAVIHGHYPDEESAESGIEVEGVTAATLSGQDYLFAGSEKGSFVAAYRVFPSGQAEFVQLLPTGLEPEGIITISDRSDGTILLVTANEEDGSVNIFQANEAPYQATANAPLLMSTGTDIPWGALSGLTHDGTYLYAVPDNAFDDSRMYRIVPDDIADGKAVIDAAILLTDGGVNLEIDPEGIAYDGSNFWIASEGSQVSENMLYQVDASGNVLQTVPFHADFMPGTENDVTKHGYEGVAVSGDGQYLYLAMQRGFVTDDDYARILRYDIGTGDWISAKYPMHDDGEGWMGLSDITLLDDDQTLLVVERDKGVGNSAVHKKIYSVDLSGMADDGELSKTLVSDLLADHDMRQEKVEGMTVFGGDIWVLNDNDGAGWTRFINVGAPQ